MTRKSLIILALMALGTSALAHSGVKNPAVKARMDAMSEIGAATKTLGQMAKGAIPFDREASRQAAATIARAAQQTPALFESYETDPKSEARPEIWEDFPDFTAKSRELEEIAASFATSIEGAPDVDTAVRALGASCKACHERYRE